MDARRLGPFRRYLAQHPRAADVALALCFLIPSLTNGLLVLAGATQGPAWRGWGLVAVALAGGALLLRRRYEPLLVAAGVTALGVASIALFHDSGSLELAAAFTIYAVAATRPPWLAWSVLGAQAMALLVAATLFLSEVPVPSARPAEFDSSTSVGPLSSVLIVGQLIAIALGTGVRGRRQHIADLVDRANALARDRERRSQLAVAAERERIAHEMHDVVAHSLTVMVALAEGARAASGKDPARSEEALSALTETGRFALGDMRRVLGVLRDPEEEAPLAPARAIALDDLLGRFRAAGLPVRLVLSGEVPPPSVPARCTADRIVQEALTNALRYAPDAAVVVVELRRRDERARGGRDWLDVVIADQGSPRGGPSRRGIGTGRGIIGMRERAAIHGGSLTAGPDGDGWRVHAALRLDDDTEDTTR
ncbi:sensor histidine kinase [Agromyces salentinus]|uniref:histidine kinase n=1 Tax=Agromyces salentinus TaxID=269421 RepID=A0ABN2MH80_9MICO|nr:histidine kinase [Agromyces salentinus]